MDRILDDVEAVVDGGALAHAAFDTAAGHRHGETARVVIAACIGAVPPTLPATPRPHSPPQMTSVSSRSPRRLRSVIKAALAWSVSRQRARHQLGRRL